MTNERRRMHLRSGSLPAVAGVVVAGLTLSAMAGPEECIALHGSALIHNEGLHWFIEVDGFNTLLQCQSFDIASNEMVTFTRNGVPFRVLNYIPSTDPTRIDGQINAAGTVYFVNPAGVFFGGTAIVNVTQLYAAAADLGDPMENPSDLTSALENVLDVNNTGVVSFGAVTGEVVVEGAAGDGPGGLIQADAVHLVGQTIRNAGVIQVPEGGVLTMSAGDRVVITEIGGSVMVEIPASTPTAGPGVENEASGRIEAAGAQVILGAGDMYSLAVRHSGTLDAGDLTMSGSRFEVETDVTADSARFEGMTEIGGDITADDGITFTDDVEFTGDEQTIDAGGTSELQFAADVRKDTEGDLNLVAGTVNFNNADGESQRFTVADALDVDANIKKTTGGALDLVASELRLSGDRIVTTDGDLGLVGNVIFDSAGAQLAVARGSGSELQIAGDVTKDSGDLRLAAQTVNFNNADGNDQLASVGSGLLDIDANVKKTSTGDLTLNAVSLELSGRSIATTDGSLAFGGEITLDREGKQTIAAAGDEVELLVSNSIVKTTDGDLYVLAPTVNFDNPGPTYTHVIQAIDGILLNEAVAIPAFATIGATGDLEIVSTNGDVRMGQNQKLTVLGDLTMRAELGTIVIGDINTRDDLLVDAAAIQLLSRDAGLVASEPEGSDGFVFTEDAGLDVISGGRIDFTVVPKFANANTVVQFATPRGENISPTLQTFVQRAYGSVTDEALLATNGQYFDLSAQGGSITLDPDASLSGWALPRDPELELVVEELTIGLNARRRLVESLSIEARLLSASEAINFATSRGLYTDAAATTVMPAPSEIVVNRMMRSLVLQVLAQYDEMTAAMSPEEAQRTLDDAWLDFWDASGDDVDPSAFPVFLADNGEHDAYACLQRLNTIFALLDDMGPNSSELVKPRDLLIRTFKPEDMEPSEFRESVSAAPPAAPVASAGEVTLP